jgi:hypothetical protein
VRLACEKNGATWSLTRALCSAVLPFLTGFALVLLELRQRGYPTLSFCWSVFFCRTFFFSLPLSPSQADFMLVITCCRRLQPPQPDAAACFNARQFVRHFLNFVCPN